MSKSKSNKKVEIAMTTDEEELTFLINQGFEIGELINYQGKLVYLLKRKSDIKEN